MTATLDRYVSSVIQEAKTRARTWHQDNPYKTKICEGCSVLETRNYLSQGEAWEDGFLAFRTSNREAVLCR